MSSLIDAIVLVGPMGVGKTTVGRKLAKALKRSFTDTDTLIVKAHGPISEIFQTQGEPIFRAYEEQAVLQAVDLGGVIATGGGALLSKRTRELLKQNATVVYLSTDGKHIASRLKGNKRPLLQNSRDDWQQIYAQRKPIYEAAADITVDTSGQPLKQTVQDIIERLGIA